MKHTSYYQNETSGINQLLKTLSDHTRREIIRFFENNGDATSINELARHVDGRIPDSSRGVIETKLLHSHLPRLEEDGWIEYDERSGMIVYLGHGPAQELLYDVVGMFEG